MTLNDPRLAACRELKGRTLAARYGHFVAEGEHLIERLLGRRCSRRLGPLVRFDLV